MEVANDVEALTDRGEGLDLKERSDSLVGRIAADIARDISEGRLAPGADLNSVELAARFGTSRTPVREALMLLETEGLVEIPPRRRPRVAQISLAEVEELYGIRAALNGLMIELFVRNAGEAEMDRMVDLHRAMKVHALAGRLAAYEETKRELHNHWLSSCGNASLHVLLRTWKMRMSVARLVGARGEELDRALLDHDRIVVACLDRDIALASALIKSMTLFGLEAIKRHHGQRF
jgi:DNA-binding GntR family transcriptional regulator